MVNLIEAKIFEMGNGFPEIGEYLLDLPTGRVFTLHSYEGPIHTSSPGCGNYNYVKVEEVDVDLDEDYEFYPCGFALVDVVSEDGYHYCDNHNDDDYDINDYPDYPPSEGVYKII